MTDVHNLIGQAWAEERTRKSALSALVETYQSQADNAIGRLNQVKAERDKIEQSMTERIDELNADREHLRVSLSKSHVLITEYLNQISELRQELKYPNDSLTKLVDNLNVRIKNLQADKALIAGERDLALKTQNELRERNTTLKDLNDRQYRRLRLVQDAIEKNEV